MNDGMTALFKPAMVGVGYLMRVGEARGRVAEEVSTSSKVAGRFFLKAKRQAFEQGFLR